MGAARELLDEALALPAEERAALVEALSESEPVALSREWQDEIQRRIAAIERGETLLVRWDDVRARLRAKTTGR